MKALPFQIVRSLSTDLTAQVADGVRRAIETGYYGVGDALPSFRKMAELLGVSEIVTRHAIRRLAEAGLVASRPRVGVRVCAAAERGWRGQILFLHRAPSRIYYFSLFAETMEEDLRDAGYLLRRVFVSDEEAREGFPRVRLELGRQNDLVIVEGRFLRGLDRFLARAKVPFLHIGSEISPRAAWGLAQRRAAVIPALLNRVRASGVRSILQVNFHRGEELDAAAALRGIGLKVKAVTVPAAAGHPEPESAAFGALDYFGRFLRARRNALPDLLLFDDDHLARGGLLALSLAGLRVPGDVQVVTWSNTGMVPEYPVSIARIEMDGTAHGHAMAAYARKILAGGVPAGASPRLVAPVFVSGATLKGERHF